MLVYKNMFLKPFFYKKQQFKIYFILIFLSVFSLILILNFDESLNKTLLSLNDDQSHKMIVVSKLKNEKSKNIITNLDEVDKFYKLYDTIIVDSSLGKIDITYSQLSEYAENIVKGDYINHCSNCIILPQHINLDNEIIELSNYLGKKINLSYVDGNNNLYKANVDVVGIYMSNDNKSIVSTDVLEKLHISLDTDSYMLITKKVEDVDTVLDKINNISQSSVYNLSAYNQNKVLMLFTSILKILFGFIVIGLLIIVSTLINSIIFDMKKDIAIMRAYGFSNLLIIKNIFFIIFVIFCLCFFTSILLDYLLINFTFLKKYLTILSFFENINVFVIFLLIILISSIISVFILKKKTIYYLLKI